jgi:L-asparaginase
LKITIINTGGTFNKRYNPLEGKLEVPKDNIALDKVIASCYNVEFEIKNIISKDSLEMDDTDRGIILDAIEKAKNDKIIVIHGTDTVDITAEFVKKHVKNKTVVFTGAMVPMSIDEVEATLNFSAAIGFLNANVKDGVYLSMHAAVIEASKLIKNRAIGRFLIQE